MTAGDGALAARLSASQRTEHQRERPSRQGARRTHLGRQVRAPVRARRPRRPGLRRAVHRLRESAHRHRAGDRRGQAGRLREFGRHHRTGARRRRGRDGPRRAGPGRRCGPRLRPPGFARAGQDLDRGRHDRLLRRATVDRSAVLARRGRAGDPGVRRPGGGGQRPVRTREPVRDGVEAARGVFAGRDAVGHPIVVRGVLPLQRCHRRRPAAVGPVRARSRSAR